MPAGCCQAWQTAGQWSLAAVLQTAKNPVIILTFSCPKFYSWLWKLLLYSHKGIMEAVWHYIHTRFESLHEKLSQSQLSFEIPRRVVKTSPGQKRPVNLRYYWATEWCVHKENERRGRESVKIYYWQMEEQKMSLTIFGHLSYDVGYFRGARRLGVQQGGEQGKNAHLLDFHTGLSVYRRKRG